MNGSAIAGSEDQTIFLPVITSFKALCMLAFDVLAQHFNSPCSQQDSSLPVTSLRDRKLYTIAARPDKLPFHLERALDPVQIAPFQPKELHLAKLMNKKQALLEQMIALSLLAYVVGVWFCEAIRDVVYGKLDIAQVPQALLNKPPVDANQHPKWLLYSGLFVLLKQKLLLSKRQVDAVTIAAASAFGVLVCGNVRSIV